MHHADEYPRDVHAKGWRVRRAGLRRRHAGPGELGVAAVIDLRVLDAQARTLREAMVVAKAKHLRPGVADSDRASHVARLGVERLDSANAYRNGSSQRPRLVLDVAFRPAK